MLQRVLCSVVASFALACSTQAQNQALTLTNGVAGRVDYPISPFSVPPDGITIEAWITYDDSTIVTGLNRWPTIVRHTDTPNAESYIFRVQAGATAARNLSFVARSPTSFQGVGYNFAVGEFVNWTHVAATFDGTTGRIYVNGLLVATAPITGPILDGGSNLRVGDGDQVTPGAEVWNGQIDELRIWPFARNQAEIQETMNNTLFAIPGGLTMNFDGDFVETSQGLLGTSTGAVGFVPGTTLPPASVGGGRFGAPSTNCAGNSLTTSLGSTSRAGNTAFELVCIDAPRSATGGVLLAAGQSPVGLPVIGIDIWVNPAALLPLVPPVTSNAQGFARLPIALGAATQIGLNLSCQFVFLDAACGAQGLVASEGIQFTVQ